jgi:hypothetical protein
MRITLVGVLGCLAVAALLVYAGYELHRVMLAGPQDPPKFEPLVNP